MDIRPVVQLVVVFLLFGCRPSRGFHFDPSPEWDAGSPENVDAETPQDTGPAIALTLLRVVPARGPFSGGNTVILRGSGFPVTPLAITFGSQLVPSADVRWIDPNRIEVRVPPGAPGMVNVGVSDGAQNTVLEAGYRYESVSISPAVGPPTGGTRVTLRSSSNHFSAETEVTIGEAPCVAVALVNSMELTCRTPAGPLGSADVMVNAEGSRTVLEDGFTYEDPFQPGRLLGGGPLEGTLTVLVLDHEDEPLPGALVTAGREGALIHRGITDHDGTIVLTGDDLSGAISVFAAESCHMHAGLVGFNAAYMVIHMPLLNIGCLPGGPGGPTPDTDRGKAEGEIVFIDTSGEFPSETFDWIGVPSPGPGEQRVAYVAMAPRQDTSSSEALRSGPELTGPVRVIETPTGTRGYPFSIAGIPTGSAVVPAAVAGLESSGNFVPHVAGVGSPIHVLPGETVRNVIIPMDARLTAGRVVSAVVPSGLPALGMIREGDVIPTTIDRMEVRVRYSIPTIAPRLPLPRSDAMFRQDAADIASLLPETLTIPAQPDGSGVFEMAEQEITVGLTTSSPDDMLGRGQPYTSRIVRAPLGTTPIEATHFLGFARFTTPEAHDAVLPADRTLRWSVEGDAEASLQFILIDANYARTTARGWAVLAHPNARAMTLPDLRREERFEPLYSGRNTISITLVDLPTVRFGDSSTGDTLEGGGAIARASRNSATFTGE